MIQRAALTTSAMAVSAALILSGCTGNDDPAQEEQSASATPSAENGETQDDQGDDQTAYGKLIDGFPGVIEPLPEAEIVSSTLSPADESEPAGDESADAPEGEDTAGGKTGVSLVQLSEKPEDEILKFYTDSLKGKGFETVGDATKEGDVTTQAFHEKNNDQTLSLTVGPGPKDDKDKRQVTIGGVVVQ